MVSLDPLQQPVDYSKERCPACPSNGPNDNENWILCDVCRIWFHDSCQGLNPKQVDEIVWFHCMKCTKTHGLSEKRRVSSRKKHHIDYVALDAGDTHGAMLAGSSRHNHWNRLFSSNIQPHAFIEAKTDLDEYFSYSNKLKTPLIIRKENYPLLNMSVPEQLSVTKVVELVGPDRELAVMDVKTQQNSPGWDLGKFEKYFTSPIDERETQFNVISLEVTGTLLGDEVIRPKIVRNMDLIDRIWPKNRESEKPKVSLYCLMSVQDSFTDFHIDFGGSSVFYHVCQGQKTFLFIEPTKSNLLAYEKWCLMQNQNSVFFADLVPICYRVDLDTNDSLIIPSGWIHAVYTPKDALITGGNFLTAIDMDMQLQIVEIEKKTKVPQKFRFPYFSKTMWYTCLYYLEEQNRPSTRLELKGLEHVYEYLSKLIELLKKEESSKADKTRRYLPKEVKKEPEKTVKQFGNKLKQLREMFDGLKNPKLES